MEGNVNAFQEDMYRSPAASAGEAQNAAFKPYRKGEDVLIDCLLLSRCHELLKCTSAVGEFATYFNRQILCKDMNVKHRDTPVPAKKKTVNPTERSVLVYDNTHARAMQPWGWLFGRRWLKRQWVAALWTFCAVRLGWGVRRIAS